jgi:two-component system cell cycle response regulator DivK
MEELIMPKILLIEDDETNIDMLSRRLQSKGYHVVAALDGRQGHSLARSENPDLILMDISLPTMDGWEVSRLLKASQATRHIPIIALTAHALITDREKAREVGCDEYETKPIEFGRLSRKIDNLLLDKKLA